MIYKPLYKMDEVCQLFNITPPTIYNWIKHGKLKPKKVRSRVYFLWNDIQELLQEKRANNNE
ncbi:MAG: helix-turn-helix domain-containing protein [Chitinophagaceae bacterium]|nr:helix-turn-helix domain-containing protein [Chitinophagaceae bacterium]